MRIYLAKPGGPVHGPYALGRINTDLATRKYRDDDFWAWHNGLTNWVPLYSIGGVSGAVDTTLFFAKRAGKASRIAAKPPEPPGPDTTIFLARPPWLHAVQQGAKSSRPKAPDRLEVKDTVLMATEPVRKQPESPGKTEAAETTEAAVCVARKSEVDEAPREVDASAPATREVFSCCEPLAPEPRSPELEKSLLISIGPSHGESHPSGGSKPAETALCAAPTSMAVEPSKKLNAPAHASGALSTRTEPRARIDCQAPESPTTSAARAGSRVRRTPVSRWVTRPRPPTRRSAPRSARSVKRPKGAFTSRKRVESATGGVLVRRQFLVAGLLAAAKGLRADS